MKIYKKFILSFIVSTVFIYQINASDEVVAKYDVKTSTGNVVEIKEYSDGSFQTPSAWQIDVDAKTGQYSATDCTVGGGFPKYTFDKNKK